MERNLQDALSVVRNVFINPRLVPGGGALEMALAEAFFFLFLYFSSFFLFYILSVYCRRTLSFYVYIQIKFLSQPYVGCYVLSLILSLNLRFFARSLGDWGLRIEDNIAVPNNFLERDLWYCSSNLLKPFF